MASSQLASGSARRRLPLAAALAALTALVMFLVLYPMTMLVMGSFLGPRPTSAAAANPFASYAALLRDWEPLLNTLVIGAGSTLLAVVIGVVLAWILVRTNVPGRRWLSHVVVIPFYLTPILGAVGWAILASPGSAGLLNGLIAGATGWTPFDIYTPAGIIWVLGLYYAPFCFLFTAGALSAMDPSLEEGAQVIGASLFRVARDVSLPLVMPAIAGSALLIFVQAIGQFGVPAILGMPHGFFVVTTRIYEHTAGFRPNYAAAAALGLVLFAMSGVGVYLQTRILGTGSYVTVTGRGFRPRLVDAKAFRLPFLLLVLLYVLVAVALPLGSILWAAMLRFMVSDIASAQYDWDNFKYILLEYPTTRIAIQNSLLLALGGATVTLALGGATAWAVHRLRFPGRSALQYVTLVPLAIPGMVFSLGLLWAWIRFPLLPVYGTLWILLICYITIFLPYAYRSTSSTLMQIDKSLEESASLCGARPFRAFRTITFPLLHGGLWAAWTLLFISIIKELSASALLTNSRTMVLSVAVFELWSGGSFTKVAALAVLEALIIFVVLLAARRLGRAGSLTL